MRLHRGPLGAARRRRRGGAAGDRPDARGDRRGRAQPRPRRARTQGARRRDGRGERPAARAVRGPQLGLRRRVRRDRRLPRRRRGGGARLAHPPDRTVPGPERARSRRQHRALVQRRAPTLVSARVRLGARLQLRGASPRARPGPQHDRREHVAAPRGARGRRRLHGRDRSGSRAARRLRGDRAVHPRAALAAFGRVPVRARGARGAHGPRRTRQLAVLPPPLLRRGRVEGARGRLDQCRGRALDGVVVRRPRAAGGDRAQRARRVPGRPGRDRPRFAHRHRARRYVRRLRVRDPATDGACPSQDVKRSTGMRLTATGVATLAVDLTVLANPRTPSSAPAKPPAHLHGWKRVFVDDFRHRLRRSSWGRYSGQPGGDPGGWWAPSHVVVRHGVLQLRTYRDRRFGDRWVSGGVSSARALRQRYGKYLVRFRMDAGRGVAGVLLLWPSAEHWPPEIDFAEDGGHSRHRRSMTASLHYGARNHQVQRTVRADFTRWHTIGVEWTPRRLVYTLDGRRWGRVRGHRVPAERMELDMQTQAGTCGDRWAPCPDGSTPRRVDMEIDWVAAYARRR